MRERPAAMRKRNIAAVRPLNDWAKTNERSGTRREREEAWERLPRAGDLVHELGRIDVGDRLHDREVVLGVFHRLSVELAAVRLMILLPEGLLADGRVDGQSEE